MSVAAVICLVFLTAASAAASDRCSDVDTWRLATTGASGALICAKLYGTPDCTDPFPLLFYVNSSVPDFRQVHSLSESWDTNATAVIRLGCSLRLWQNADYNGNEQSSVGNTYSVRIGSALSAKCDCSTGIRELLTCQPREELVELKTCDNSGSDRNVDCEYNWRKRPFRANLSNFTQLSEAHVSTITDTEMAEVTSFFSKVSTAPMLFQSKDISEREVTVKSYEKLRVLQRMVVCGEYVVPTSERDITRDVKPNTLMRNPATNWLYYFSSDTVGRQQADQRCRAMNARLASLPIDAYRFVAEKTLHYASSVFWWTAAEYRKYPETETAGNGTTSTGHFGAIAYWPDRYWGWPSMWQPDDNVCVAINFAAPPFYSTDSCFTSFGYICEKDNIA